LKSYELLYYVILYILCIFGGRNTFILPILRSVLEKNDIFHLDSEAENLPMLSFNVRFTLNPNWKLFLFKNNSVNPKIEFSLGNLDVKYYITAISNKTRAFLIQKFQFRSKLKHLSLEGFQFRLLQIRGIYNAFAILIMFFSDHLKWNSS